MRLRLRPFAAHAVAHAFVLVPVAGVLAPMQGHAGPEEAVVYKEQQLRKNAPQGGRTLTTQRSAFLGIDINSSVIIDIDEKRFETAVLAQLGNREPSAQDAALVAQFNALADAADKIGPAIQGVDNLFMAWSLATDANGVTAFTNLSATVSLQISTVITALQSAIERRLVASGVAPEAARTQAGTDLGAVLSGPNMVQGYNWDAMRTLYAREIDFASTAIEAELADSGLALQIRAALITGPNQFVPVHLPGYDAVAPGAATVYQKVTYSISPEKAEQFEAAQRVARELEETDSLGEAILTQIRADLAAHETQIRMLLSDVGESAIQLETAIEGLDRWRDAAVRSAWLASNRTALEASAEGRQVVASWQEVDDSVERIEAMRAAITAFAEARESLGASPSPTNALALIQATFARLAPNGVPNAPAGDLPDQWAPQGLLMPAFWNQQVATLTTFGEAVQTLAPAVRNQITASTGPVGDIENVRMAGAALLAALQDVPAAARAAFVRALARKPIEFAAGLPMPEGGAVIGIGGGTPLDTSFDLKSIAGGRTPDQEIRVEYHVLRGEQDLGLGWSDTFRIRVFGWQDHVAAGVAFAQQEGAETWKPTATLSWLLKKHRWPDNDETGIDFGTPEWYSGFGLSTLPLDFDDEQDVEVGFALTASFLNDRILIGYGSNLQVAEDDKFWFISFRLFQNDGLIDNVATR